MNADKPGKQDFSWCLESSKLGARLALVTNTPDHRLLGLEHWLPQQPRCGTILPLQIIDSAPLDSGWLAKVLPTDGLSGQSVIVRSNNNYRKRQRILATLVARASEVNKAWIATDRLLLRGRYLHLVSSDNISSRRNSATKTAFTSPDLPSTLAFVPQPVSNLVTQQQIQHEAEFLLAQLANLQQQLQQSQPATFSESPEYFILRQLETKHQQIFCNQISSGHEMQQLAKQLWPDVSAAIPTVTQNSFKEFELDGQIINLLVASCQLMPGITLRKVITDIVTCLDIDWDRKNFAANFNPKLLELIIRHLKLLRCQGRIVIDLPINSGKNYLAWRKAWNSLTKHSRVKPAAENYYHHPALDDLPHLVKQRFNWETMSPSGLLIINQQAFDQALASIYFPQTNATTSAHHLSRYFNPELALHLLFAGLTTTNTYHRKLTITLSADSQQIIRTHYQQIWDDIAGRFFPPPTLLTATIPMTEYPGYQLAES